MADLETRTLRIGGRRIGNELDTPCCALPKDADGKERAETARLAPRGAPILKGHHETPVRMFAQYGSRHPSNVALSASKRE